MPHPVRWRFRTQLIDDAIVVNLPGRRIVLKEQAALGLREQLLRLPDETDVRHLILDLSNICYMTSTTVEALLALRRKLKHRGGHLTLARLTPAAAEVLAVLKLDAAFDIRQDIPESAPPGEPGDGVLPQLAEGAL